MPHTTSAKKHLRKTVKQNQYNRRVKKGLKLAIRAFTDAVKTGTPEQVQTAYNEAAKKFDKAAAHNVIHRNKAARKKSQFARALTAKKAPAQS